MKFNSVKRKILKDISKLDYSQIILDDYLKLEPQAITPEVLPSSEGGIDLEKPIEYLADIKGYLESLNANMLNFFEWNLGQDLKREEERRERVNLLESIADAVGAQSLAGEQGGSDKKKGLLGMLSGVLGKGAGGAVGGIGEGIGGAIGGIGSGVGKAIGGLGKGLGEGIGGLVKGIGKGLGKALAALSNPKYFIGVAVLTALAGAIWVAGKAFNTFGDDINWKNVGIGVGILAGLGAVLALLGGLSAQMLVGAVALAAISGAIFIAGKAFQQFADINWKGVGIGALALLGFSLAAAGLSFVAGPMIIGAAAIAILGLALIPFAYAMEIFSKAAVPFAEAMSIMIGAIAGGVVMIIESMVVAIERFAAIGGEQLISVAAGITAIGLALAAYGGGSIAAGIGTFVGNLIGGDPIKRFERFAQIGTGLDIAAKAIKSIGVAITEIDADALTDSGEGFRSFIASMSGGFIKGNPIAKIRDLTKALVDAAPNLDVLNSIAGVFNSLGALSSAFADKEKLDTIKSFFTDMFETEVNRDILTFFYQGAKFLEALQDTNIEKLNEFRKIANPPQKQYGDEIQAMSAVAKENERNGSVEAAVAVVNNTQPAPRGGGNNTNVSNITVNNSAQIDRTQSTMLGSNAF
jgi:hypothetical protein